MGTRKYVCNEGRIFSKGITLMTNKVILRLVPLMEHAKVHEDHEHSDHDIDVLIRCLHADNVDVFVKEVPIVQVQRLLWKLDIVRAAIVKKLMTAIVDLQLKVDAHHQAQISLSTAEPACIVLDRDDKLLDVKEAAHLLRHSEDWVYKHAKRLPFTVRMSGRLHFSRQGIQEYLKEKRHAAVAG